MHSPSRLLGLKKKALDDPYFFCKEILGYDKMRPHPHKELCDFVRRNTGKRKKLILMPRGSFKSSVVTIGFSLWKLINNPNERILIASEIQKNAKKYAKEVKSHIESNSRFKALFGELRSDKGSQKNTWKDDEFIINTRTKVYKEPTVQSGSLEKGALTGMHFNSIVLDDVVSQNTVNTPNQIQKTLNYYRLLLSILEPDGCIYVIGTRYSLNDLYGHILDPGEGELEQFDYMIKTAISDNGTYLMPDILSKKFLDEQLKTQGAYIWNCQYQNRPMSPDTSTLNADDIQYYEKEPKNLIYFITLDPAISLNQRADFSGIIVNGVDSEENWWIVEAIRVKVEPSDLIDIIFELVIKYVPQCVAMEKFMLEKALREALISQMNIRDVNFALREIPTNTRVSKEYRVRALQPIFQQKKIFIKKSQTDLIHELIHHPQVKNDDLIDALKSQIGIVYPAPFDAPPVEDGYETKSWKERQVWLSGAKKIRTVQRRKKWIQL